ncbi:MAG: LytTR family DNA-binding domain-containing protein [Lawsonibacter sp.]|nr:LytTR family DNA-binding domain-containing protein [Lawsonibacter sp.]
MPVKIMICDDRAEDIARLSAALYAYDPSFEITSFTDGTSLAEEFLNGGLTADLLFLDIYMPGIDGITTARELRAQHKDIKIIFISSSDEHYPEAYEVFAFNYILKPVDRERLSTVLSRALEELGRENVCKISFSYKSASYSVDCRDILYIESRDKLLLFHLADGIVLQTYWRLDEVIKELPQQAFIRCHQSFIVNISHITEMGESYFRIRQVPIGISRKYMKSSKEQYYAYLFSSMCRGRPQ